LSSDLNYESPLRLSKTNRGDSAEAKFGIL